MCTYLGAVIHMHLGASMSIWVYILIDIVYMHIVKCDIISSSAFEFTYLGVIIHAYLGTNISLWVCMHVDIAFLGQILICVYPTYQYGEISVFCTILCGSYFPPSRACLCISFLLVRCFRFVGLFEGDFVMCWQSTNCQQIFIDFPISKSSRLANQTRLHI